ncbi:Maph49 [Matsumuraeses phaseoli granulovirus]|uniref:Maph49 n=1 Tax=Matsumuraeses phaseoli granulovirus TaxID=2760664 RepID=A0AAE7MLD1_9BBAC|nr:Maph49 [Matsumuraeses phaseoli granulovirus]QOD40012.1 Maph49 [Matsumuraeses phaseoli granulovirus]
MSLERLCIEKLVCTDDMFPLDYLLSLNYFFTVLPLEIKRKMYLMLPEYKINYILLGLQIQLVCCNKTSIFLEFVCNYFCSICFTKLFKCAQTLEYVKRVCHIYHYESVK